MAMVLSEIFAGKQVMRLEMGGFVALGEDVPM